MMKIKVLMMMMLMMVFVFTSCNQENVVPDSAAATIDNNVDITTEDPGLEDEEEDEDLEEGDEDKDEDEDMEEGEENETEEEEGEEIDPSTLPQTILDYISENYPNAMIEEAEQYANGDYEVELDTDVELMFDSDGNFLGEGD